MAALTAHKICAASASTSPVTADPVALNNECRRAHAGAVKAALLLLPDEVPPPAQAINIPRPNLANSLLVGSASSSRNTFKASAKNYYLY